MACDFCKDENSLKELCSRYDAHFCPVCGESLTIAKVLINIQKEFAKKRISELDKTVEIDGEILIYDRTPIRPINLKEEKPIKDPRIRPYNPDNVDISKELEMLKKHDKKEHDRQEELKIALSESLKRAIIRKKLRDYAEELLGFDFDY